MLMEKCHCASVPFKEIVELAIRSCSSYESVASDLNAGETCTACREDMKSYCESSLGCPKSRLQLQGAL
jgi:bacterioferritin-associated ferredoxin